MEISGFKIDFLDRDDQTAVEMTYRIAEMAAKYKLTLDLHGFYEPTGLNRTYPNIINFESVFGMEEMKWSTVAKDMMEYDVTMPYIRMMTGPVDYTPGAMRNASKKDFKDIYYNPMSQGTRCRQLAQYVVFDSPLNMLCDAPTNYMKEEECTKFIAAIPTVWDDTKVLNGKIGEYLAIARQKDGIWYVGALTNWDARDMELDLSFLGKDVNRIEIFEDGINADRVGKDYRRKVISLSADKKIKIHMAPGGGFVMRTLK